MIKSVNDWGTNSSKQNDEMNHQMCFSTIILDIRLVISRLYFTDDTFCGRSRISTRNKRKRSIYRIAVYNKQNNKIIGFS